MRTSKILTSVIIGTSYGIEPIATQYSARQNRSKMSILWRSIQRRNKIKKIWKIDGIV
jgi:hypothetical protein